MMKLLVRNKDRVSLSLFKIVSRRCLPTRKSSSGKADMKTGSIAWRKSKP